MPEFCRDPASPPSKIPFLRSPLHCQFLPNHTASLSSVHFFRPETPQRPPPTAPFPSSKIRPTGKQTKLHHRSHSRRSFYSSFQPPARRFHELNPKNPFSSELKAPIYNHPISFSSPIKLTTVLPQTRSLNLTHFRPKPQPKQSFFSSEQTTPNQNPTKQQPNDPPNPIELQRV
ncbi:hypothetical protein AABB24_005792 [Solanum stoloniferum]|uniref:Uncharacterized protein n=1 Tax=Solanum stoloniferum TaxID=62892 RepID=A0ABD2UZ75_9SOLN